MENRIADCITRYGERIDAQGETGLTGKPVDHLHEDLAISMAEFVAYQNAQTRAHVEGRITTEEASTLYMALGGETYHGDWPKRTPLATKIVVTQVMHELISMEVMAETGVRR
jgi:hypothetical protein